VEGLSRIELAITPWSRLRLAESSVIESLLAEARFEVPVGSFAPETTEAEDEERKTTC